MSLAFSDAIPPSRPVRLHGLDALRSFAAVLVVLLHAGIPYMLVPLSHLPWPGRDAHPSLFVDVLTWCTECFLMPLFFVLAGFFSEGLLVSHGARNFLRERTKRLLWTQIAASLVVLPPCFYLWSLGFAADGLYLPQGYLLPGLPAELKVDLFGASHLWFLQNLYIYSLILWGTSCLAKQFRQGASKKPTLGSSLWLGVTRVLQSVWKPLVPAIPCALILFWDPRVVLGFYQTFLPVCSKLLYFAVFFAAGVGLYRQRDVLHLHQRYGKSYLAISAVLFCGALPLIREQAGSNLTGIPLALLSGLLALFASFATFGLFAVFSRTRWGDNAVARFLSEASFWTYLVHLPLVVLAQLAVADLAIPTWGKFLLASATALGLALASFRVGVRNTWLGAFLNGHSGLRRNVTDALRRPADPSGHRGTASAPLSVLVS